MTNKELIECLKNFPDDLLVLVDGYEDGYTPLRIEAIYRDTFVDGAHPGDYNGTFEKQSKISEDGYGGYERSLSQPIAAIVLSRHEEELE